MQADPPELVVDPALAGPDHDSDDEYEYEYDQSETEAGFFWFSPLLQRTITNAHSRPSI